MNDFEMPDKEDYRVNGLIQWGKYCKDLERYCRYLERKLKINDKQSNNNRSID